MVSSNQIKDEKSEEKWHILRPVTDSTHAEEPPEGDQDGNGDHITWYPLVSSNQIKDEKPEDNWHILQPIQGDVHCNQGYPREEICNSVVHSDTHILTDATFALLYLRETPKHSSYPEEFKSEQEPIVSDLNPLGYADEQVSLKID